MTEISLEKLDALIEKGRELKKLLTQTPEILTYLQLINDIDDDKIQTPKIDDVLIRAGDAARILGVNQSTISHYVKSGRLRGYLVAGSSHLKFWRSEVKALAVPA